jgi:hypothetical protein
MVKNIKLKLKKLNNELSGKPFEFLDAIYITNELLLLKEENGLLAENIDYNEIANIYSFAGLLLKTIENGKHFKNKKEFIKFIYK